MGINALRLAAMAVATAVLCGCTSVFESALGVYGRTIGINEGINALHLSARDDGYRLHVGGIVTGPPVDKTSGWEDVSSFSTPTGLAMQLTGLAEYRKAVGSTLSRALPACDSPRRMLERGLSRVEPLVRQMTYGSELPAVVLRLVLPGQGLLNHEAYTAPHIAGLKMALAVRLPEEDRCEQHQRWAAETLATVVHEWTHIHVYQRFGARTPQLGNEVAASAIEQSVVLELLGSLPARYVHMAGEEDSDDIAQVLKWQENRGLSTTLAGKLLADRFRRRALGDRDLGPSDAAALHAFTARALSHMVDPRDPASVARLVGGDTTPP